MQKFTYYSPTEVVFGKDAEARTAECVSKYGGTKVFLVYGGGSAVRSGLIGRVEQMLKDAGIACECFGGAQPNPTLQHAREGVEKAIAFGANFILAVGGGSSIDTAKAIAHGAANPGIDINKFWTHEVELTKSTPIGVILTLSAAGSETSASSVLTDKTIGRKRGLNTDMNRPKFAIMNPELTYSLPVYQVACGVTDIMMHTMDRYFNPIDNELTDAIAEALLRTVIEKGRKAVMDPHDYDAMSEIMWAGSLSHNGLTGLGGAGDWAVHQLGHELSARFDLAHGASLAAVWGTWARYVVDVRPERFARYARNVWGIVEPNDQEAAHKGIEATEAYFTSIGMPTRFGLCVGVQDEETLRQLAVSCTYDHARTIGTLKKLGEEEILEIYRGANR